MMDDETDKRVMDRLKKHHDAIALQSDPLKKQVGGDHYQSGGIQPIEFIHANHLGFCEGSVVKYVVRHRRKNGREDLQKAIHYLELLISLEYPEIPTD